MNEEIIPNLANADKKEKKVLSRIDLTKAEMEGLKFGIFKLLSDFLKTISDGQKTDSLSKTLAIPEHILQLNDIYKKIIEKDEDHPVLKTIQKEIIEHNAKN